MSPSQFVREIGGEQSHIALCFRQLAKWDFIELVDERRGGRRRGGVEHVYRAVRRPKIDNETAEKLPLPLREDISVNILGAYFRQVAAAAAAGTFDQELERHLSRTTVTLDRDAWRVLIGRLDETLASFPDFRLQAAERMAESGEEPRLLTIGLAGFRAAGHPAVVRQPRPSGIQEAEDELGGPIISQDMAKVLTSPWRARILAEVSVRPMSPSQFAEEFGGDLSHVARCFRQLAKAGYLDLVDRRKGTKGSGPAAVEHVYRAKQRARIPPSAWTSVPRSIEDSATARLLTEYLGQFTEAIEAGTFDADTDRHLSWDMLWLDRRGIAAAVARLDEILAWVPELEAEAKRRLAASGEEPITTTVALAAFRSPSPPRMAT